jgi:hypothetical protein
MLSEKCDLDDNLGDKRAITEEEKQEEEDCWKKKKNEMLKKRFGFGPFGKSVSDPIQMSPSKAKLTYPRYFILVLPSKT